MKQTTLTRMRIMNFKTRLIALLLLLCLIAAPLVACNSDNDEDSADTPDTNDEFTGSIAGTGTENSGSEQESTPTAPPITEGDENSTVLITSFEDLKNKIAQKGTFVLQNDIVITEAFSPIGTYVYPFLGTFDGNGYKITFTAAQSDEGIGFSPTFKFVYCGLFGVTRDATVKNLTLDVTAVASSSKQHCFVLTGGIAGYMINTEVSGCTVNGALSSKSEFFNSYCGNIAGVMQGGKITNCTANASISALDSENRAVAGGLVGYCIDEAAVSFSTVNGDIKATSTNGIAYAGGLVGNTLCATFTACRSNGSVYAEILKYKATDKTHGAAFAGGLIGVASGDSSSKKADFKRCYAPSGTVTAIGNNNTAYGAGIAASVTYGSFTHCYSLQSVNVKTGINIGYAASMFASLNSSSSSTTAVPPFLISGCFARGSVELTH